MTTSCPQCGQSYEFATVRLQGKDRMATCGKCGHRFTVRLPGPRPTEAAVLTQRGRPATTANGALAPHVRIALTPMDGPLKDQVFRITGRALIGRGQGEVPLPDPRVSSRHAEVEVAGGEVFIRDLGSTNGTFVNRERVTDRRRLAHMDEITVGGTRLLYTYIEDFVSAYESFAPGDEPAGR